MPRRAIIAALAIVAAQCSINIGAALAKGLFPLLGPEGVAALRTSLSALLLLPLGRPWRAGIGKRDVLPLLGYGLMLGGMNLLIYGAFQRIPIGIAIAVEIAGPMTLVLLTSRSISDLLWFLLAAGSLALLVPWPGSDAPPLDPVGIALALGAALCWALYILCGKRVAAIGGNAAVAVGMTLACLVTLPFGLGSAGVVVAHPALFAIGLMVALLSSALPYRLEMAALSRISSRLFGVIISSAPAIGALAGFAILGERLSALQCVAIAGMIGASAGCALTVRRRRA